MLEITLKIAALLIFAIAGIMVWKTERLAYYKKFAAGCTALSLVIIASFIDSFIAYFLQLFAFALIAKLASRYYRKGIFRRRKELSYLYKGKRKEHREARKMIYPHLKDIDTKERHLEEEKALLERAKEELRKEAELIKEEKRKMETEKKSIKDAYYDVFSERSGKK